MTDKTKTRNLTLKKLQKLCEEHNLVEKIKSSIDLKAAITIINTVLSANMNIVEEVVAKYIENLNEVAPDTKSLKNLITKEELEKFCKERELISKVNNASTDEEAMELIKVGLLQEKDFTDETIIAYRQLLINPPTTIDSNMLVQKLEEFCKENKLKDAVKNATDTDAMNIIIEKLSEGKSFTLETVIAYRKLLINPPTVINELVQELQEICIKYELEDKIKKTMDDNEAIELIKNTFYNGRSVDIKTVRAYKLLLKGLDLSSGEAQEIKNAIALSKDNAISLEALKTEIKHLNDTISQLKVENEALIEKSPPEQSTIKDKLMFQIRNLNELFNSNGDKVDVSINKEILVKATKFVDDNSLISLENIIKNGYDLNSTIVQSILFAFIHQNSLL